MDEVGWMAYAGSMAFSHICGNHRITGSLAVLLAEKAHDEGRLAEARGLVELAYRLFDEAADVSSPAEMAYTGDLHPA